ncbi:accessory gene regulator B family protein [uncultured Clostridium sp.]|uniref:accessory gene regulator B family protein n=1 Tax=uncultured Clostridium sp. TaxID=59620 RepID=UPI0025F360A0|nr:accessory gene regulator B family protein [uncultured Clostridium sp.]MDU4883289.1 accessory gene regulator B family protein [Clostridium celatum]MDU7076364.1 accessory gene regulator B family protein [Clostridium celatum]
MNPFIKKQLDFIVNTTGKTDIYEIDNIRYGLEVLYGEFFKLLIMFIISLLLNKFSVFILLIILLILIRPLIGGSHAKTYIGCMIQSNILFISIYYLAYILPKVNTFIHIIIITLSIIIVRVFNPVNPKRKTVNTHYKNFKFKNIVTIVLISWFVISTLFLSNYYIKCGLLLILYIIIDFFKEAYKNEKKITI